MIVKRPPMGVNTWNTFGENISEEIIKSLADSIVEKGLLKAGFNYLNVDGGWQEKERDKEGNLVVNKQKFPNGLKPVIDYVHNKGLKFGIYSCAGVMTCCGNPGSYGYEFKDAQFFADLGVDYLKYDYCYTPHVTAGNRIYHKMGMALRATGKDIVFSACNWGLDGVHGWAKSSGANLFRSTFDIMDNFESFMKIALEQLNKLESSGYNCFNDMDMLTVGMYGKGHVGRGGCTFEEYKLQYSLWCMFGVPLIIGGDVSKLDSDCVKLLTNKHLIRINQDEECRPPYPIGLGVNNEYENDVLFRFLSDNEYALGVFNYSEAEVLKLVSFPQTGINYEKDYAFELFDVFEEKVVGTFKDFFRVKLPAHGSKVYICKLIKNV